MSIAVSFGGGTKRPDEHLAAVALAQMANPPPPPSPSQRTSGDFEYSPQDRFRYWKIQSENEAAARWGRKAVLRRPMPPGESLSFTPHEELRL